MTQPDSKKNPKTNKQTTTTKQNPKTKQNKQTKNKQKNNKNKNKTKQTMQTKKQNKKPTTTTTKTHTHTQRVTARIEPGSASPEADVLTTRPARRLECVYHTAPYGSWHAWSYTVCAVSVLWTLWALYTCVFINRGFKTRAVYLKITIVCFPDICFSL